jgi:alkanesulfonate monooxygenase SsuD/methylene tetrahydromethanopterin reductase-like flavin-dependent oxidoreductase (luciferase family)
MPKAKWGVIYNADALTFDDVLHFAPLAQEAGADVLWTAEGWRDAFVPLTAIAGVTKEIRVGTAIAHCAQRLVNS